MVKDKVLECLLVQMALDLRESGRTTSKMVMDSSTAHQAMYTMANSKMTRLMGMESSYTQMAPNMKEIGSTIFRKVKAKNLFKMEPVMKVSTIKVANMGLVGISGQMVQFIKDNSNRINSMVKGSTFGQMVENMKVNGKRV